MFFLENFISFGFFLAWNYFNKPIFWSNVPKKARKNPKAAKKIKEAKQPKKPEKRPKRQKKKGQTTSKTPNSPKFGLEKRHLATLHHGAHCACTTSSRNTEAKNEICRNHQTNEPVSTRFALQRLDQRG
jgi:hypothetical protein